MDGDARWDQLTLAAQFPGLATNNPVISRPAIDGLLVRDIDAEARSGDALYLFDLSAWDTMGHGEPVPEPDRLPHFSPPEC